MDQRSEPSSPTIVGGQPLGKRGGATGLPHGIEAVILLAAADPRFREDFTRDRLTALERAGITLTEAETSLLAAVRDEELFAIARSARSAKPKGGRRTLMATAASLAALASLTASAPKSTASGGEPADQRPALGQLDSRAAETGTESTAQGAESASAAPGVTGAEPTPTPTEWQPVRGIMTETPTPPPIDGIRPDTPTPPPVFGIAPDTPTASPMPAGIQPDTPVPTATPLGITPDTPTSTSTPSATPTHNPADLNRDGAVDYEDLFLFLQQWYKSRTHTPKDTPPGGGPESPGEP